MLSNQILTLDHKTTKQSEAQVDYSKVTTCSLVIYVELYVCTTTETKADQAEIKVLENSEFNEKRD